MLNKDNVRELAYVVKIDNITPIDGYDRVELAHVSGWTIVVGKGEFKPGDLAVYFEIDSKLPEVAPFTEMEFLVKKKYKVKTQKMCKSISQGLLISPASFGWTQTEAVCDGLSAAGIEYHEGENIIITDDNYSLPVGTFLTQRLGVTYAVAEDNARKGNGPDKYKKMAQRHPEWGKKPIFKWLMRRTWGRKLLFVFFGKKKDTRKWPAWVVKTDEERVENMPWVLDESGTQWIATEKVDGTSTTFTMKRGEKTIFGQKPNDFYVCSRNVVFDTPEKAEKCFYDENYYVQMAEKYDVRTVLEKVLAANPDVEWVTIQGETFGSGVQKRDYSMSDVDFRAFNFIDSVNGRWNSIDAKDYIEAHSNIKCVPILQIMNLPGTIDELREYVHSEQSRIDGDMREGIVFRTLDGQRSFKCVDPEYLLKYHG